MAIQRRKFSDAEKLSILDEARREGVTAVLRKHRLSYSVFVRWKQKYGIGVTQTTRKSQGDRAISELKHLMEENGRLKKIIADQALELERKDEDLRKHNPMYGKR
ncbi:MAG TPA: transposase [Puia sp.]|jgi:putative transposase